jgi:hypothetical protein
VSPVAVKMIDELLKVDTTFFKDIDTTIWRRIYVLQGKI